LGYTEERRWQLLFFTWWPVFAPSPTPPIYRAH
jgi:hypothetical protein